MSRAGKALTALSSMLNPAGQPDPELSPQVVQFHPGHLWRTDGFDVDATLADIRRRAEKTGADSDHALAMRIESVSDLTPALYEQFANNPASIAHWFPILEQALAALGPAAPFEVPVTRIARLPIELAQYLRIEYGQTTPASREAFNKLISALFELEDDHTYFLKTGVFSSKFEFANARCTEPDQAGEYFSVINNLAMTLGAGRTVDLCVRDYIEPETGTPTIYHGMPLRTEARVFIDVAGDEPRILGMVPYWHPVVMERALALGAAEGFEHIKADYKAYQGYRDEMMASFTDHRDELLARVQTLLPELAAAGLAELDGQWSLDLMITGDQVYAIDMAPMRTSALTELLANTEEYSLASPAEITKLSHDDVLIEAQHPLRFDPATVYRSHSIDTRKKLP